ncbi:hypothetical protein UMZ34_00395 [Halopseudomonas pachastrellae]|nr:hypothetical protein UMZ34_00395 [Halopseudomonas pachastrellae]
MGVCYTTNEEIPCATPCPCNTLDFPPLRRGALDTLQVNLTYRCNQRCLHCHVNAGPTRTESMSAELIELLCEVIDAHPVDTLDLTGGAPRCTRSSARWSGAPGPRASRLSTAAT